MFLQLFVFVMSDTFSIWNALIHASLVVKIVLGLLFLLSIGSWSIFFQKLSGIKLAISRNSKFESKFWSGIMLEDFYQVIKGGKFKSFYADIFSSAMEEWMLSDITKSVMAVEFIKIGVRERILSGMEREKVKIQGKLSKGLGFLSLIASTSPFIGLFGTVWGVMNSFASLSQAGSVTLSAIAPGISEALFSTAIGLFVALPGVVFYSKIHGKVDDLNTTLDSFSIDIANVLSRELDNFSVKNYMEVNK